MNSTEKMPLSKMGNTAEFQLIKIPTSNMIKCIEMVPSNYCLSVKGDSFVFLYHFKKNTLIFKSYPQVKDQLFHRS